MNGKIRNKDIQYYVNIINYYTFKEINNNRKLNDLLMDLAGRKNPYIK